MDVFQLNNRSFFLIKELNELVAGKKTLTHVGCNIIWLFAQL